MFLRYLEEVLPLRLMVLFLKFAEKKVTGMLCGKSSVPEGRATEHCAPTERTTRCRQREL
jgi:hypothetical protein